MKARAFVKAATGTVHVVDVDHPHGLCGQMGEVDSLDNMEWYLGTVIYSPAALCVRCRWSDGVVKGTFRSETKCVKCGRPCERWGHTHYSL